MPWEHCGSAILDDDMACPACGTTKAQWTVQWEVTRVFQIGPKDERASLRILAKDADGRPLADEPYVATLPGGKVVEGRTSRYGLATVPSGPGTGSVHFPGRRAADFRDATPVDPGTGEARFAVSTDDKQVFQLRRPGVTVTLVDERREPVGDEPYEVLQPPSGARRRGVLDARGVAAIEVEGEACVVRFPDLARSAPGEPVPVDAEEVELRAEEAARGVRLQVGQRVTVIVRAHLVSVRLVDDAYAAIGGAPVTLRLPDGVAVEETTRDDGVLVVRPVTPGTCEGQVRVEGHWAAIRFPTVDDPEVVITIRVPRVDVARAVAEPPPALSGGLTGEWDVPAPPPVQVRPDVLVVRGAASATAPSAARHLVSVELVDDALQALAGAQVDVRLPDGKRAAAKTGADGRLQVDPAPPGVCHARVLGLAGGWAAIAFPTVDDPGVVIRVRVPRVEPASRAPEQARPPLDPLVVDPDAANVPRPASPPAPRRTLERGASAPASQPVDAPVPVGA